MPKFLVTIFLLAVTIQAECYLTPVISPLKNYLKAAEITENESGVPYIDCIYVINLDHREDRWNRLLPLFEKMGVKANRFSAVLGRNITPAQKHEMFGPYPIRLTGPEIGVILSYVSIVNDAYERGFNRVWIMEDDVEFLEEAGILPRFIENLTAIDKDWDVLYTDTNCRNPYDGYYYPDSWKPRPEQTLLPFHIQTQRIPVGSDLERMGTRYGMTSVILSRSGLEKIYNYFQHIYLWCPIDWDIHYIPNIREYGITRDAITNARNGLGSDIHYMPL